MNKNEFALECMERVNEFGATQPGASPASTANFDKNGNRLFYHPDGDGNFSSQEMIEWFNIMFHDEDCIADDMITQEMKETEANGRKFGFITDKTQKYW